jgi:hypothetical protein
MQDELPFEYDDKVELVQVEQVEVTALQWKEVE